MRDATLLDPAMKRLLVTLGLLLSAQVVRAAEPVDYVRDVKPLLAKYCTECHGAEKQRSGLRLDTAAAALRGGNAGPAVQPGRGAESRLIHALLSKGDTKPMPPREPRPTPREVAVLLAWIDQGARAPADERAAVTPGTRTHWAFRAPVRPAEPRVQQAAWVRNPVDAFILARLEAEGIAPAPDADRLTLLRRVSLDLVGLPPTSDEVEAFLADTQPGAYERAVERLLQSPHYGERWGRHWLDAARYADSNGFNIDAPRSMWKYRDWVIDAFNRDMPFDRFAIAQLAGDLLPGATLEDRIATGFHRNTLLNQEGGIDVEQFRIESVVDRVNTTGAVFLGLTLGCAQCHDHKYDPISQREYYELFAFFNNADEPTLEIAPPEQLERRRRLRAELAVLEKRLKVLDTTTPASLAAWEKKFSPEDKQRFPPALQAVLALPDNGRTPPQQEALEAALRQLDQVRHVAGAVGEAHVLRMPLQVHAILERNQLERRIAALKQAEPAVVTTLVMAERSTPRTTHVHLGGDFLRKGVPVTPAVPTVLQPLAGPSARPGSLPNRLDLARWLVDPRNPLTARVIVNRFWQQFFGTGLVETENDFGTQGTPPSHPELLDWLATEFVRQGWSVKAMHRLLVTSATYRQSSKARPELAVVDPRNRLLARQARLRLEAEIVRDASLAASGLLSRKVGGPSVFPPQPEGVYRFTQIPRDWKPSPGPDRYRRGLYTHFWRSAPHPALTVFDAPDSTTTCTRRNRSNTPLQALTLLNDQAFYECAEALAARVVAGTTDDRAALRQAFALCLGRPPRPVEEQRLDRLLGDARTESDRLGAWTSVARVLLNLDEFLTRE